MVLSPLRLASLAASSAIVLVASVADAAPPAADLMDRLARHAANMEVLRKSGTYSVSGRLESLDTSGQQSSVRELRGHVELVGGKSTFVVDHYTEDGEDKTNDARDEAKSREEKRMREGDNKRIRLPTLAEEQPLYTFDVVEVDANDANRVKLAFAPKERDERRIEGTAWVDAKAGTILSAGFRLSKTSLFVDWVHFKVQFGEMTPLGPAPSQVEVEGKGGLLFLVRKHFRGSARVAAYRVR